MEADAALRERGRLAAGAAPDISGSKIADDEAPAATGIVDKAESTGSGYTPSTAGDETKSVADRSQVLRRIAHQTVFPTDLWWLLPAVDLTERSPPVHIVDFPLGDPLTPADRRGLGGRFGSGGGGAMEQSLGSIFDDTTAEFDPGLQLNAVLAAAGVRIHANRPISSISSEGGAFSAAARGLLHAVSSVASASPDTQLFRRCGVPLGLAAHGPRPLASMSLVIHARDAEAALGRAASSWPQLWCLPLAGDGRVSRWGTTTDRPEGVLVAVGLPRTSRSGASGSGSSLFRDEFVLRLTAWTFGGDGGLGLEPAVASKTRERGGESERMKSKEASLVGAQLAVEHGLHAAVALMLEPPGLGQAAGSFARGMSTSELSRSPGIPVLIGLYEAALQNAARTSVEI